MDERNVAVCRPQDFFLWTTGRWNSFVPVEMFVVHKNFLFSCIFSLLVHAFCNNAFVRKNPTMIWRRKEDRIRLFMQRYVTKTTTMTMSCLSFLASWRVVLLCRFASCLSGIVLPCLVSSLVVCLVLSFVSSCLLCLVLCYLLLSCLVVLSCFVLSCALLYRLFLCCLALPCVDLYCRTVVLSCVVLCRFVLSYYCLVLYCLFVSYPILPCPILSCLALPCFVLSCLHL